MQGSVLKVKDGETNMATKVLVAQNVAADVIDIIIENIRKPPSTAKDIKKIPNADGTFNLEVTFATQATGQAP